MKCDLNHRQKNCILWASAVFFFLVYLSLCFNDNVWTDEAFTIDLLKSDFAGIIQGTASDVHPPLYYLIVKCFTLVAGSSLLSLKLVSIAPMVLLMTWGARIVWKRFGFHPALAFNVFLAVIPCTMEYAVQVRMYSWALFFVTFMAFWAYEGLLENQWRYFAGASVMAAAAAYTHYFAFVSALWIYGFWFLSLLIKKRKALVKWLAAAAASLIMYVPWLPYMKIQVRGVSKSYWIEEITGETIKEFFPFLFDMDIPYTTGIWLGLCAAGIVIAAALCVRGGQEKRQEGVFALLLLLVPVWTAAAGVVASNLIRPVFIVRYLLPCMGLLALFLALTLGRAPRRIYMALLLFLLFAGVVDYQKSVYREYTWTHTAETEEFLEEHVGEKDIVAYNYETYRLIYDYYFAPDELVLWQDIDLDAVEYETIWLLDTIYWPYPTEEYLAEKGWQKEFMGNYGIEHNDFKIFRITRKEDAGSN